MKQFNQCLFTCAQKNREKPPVQVGLYLVRGVRSVNNNWDPSLGGAFLHAETDFSHSREAHLRQKVEAVLTDDHNARLVLRESTLEALIGILNHCVEQRNREARVPNQGRSIKGTQRRIRLL